MNDENTKVNEEFDYEEKGKLSDQIVGEGKKPELSPNPAFSKFTKQVVHEATISSITSETITVFTNPDSTYDIVDLSDTTYTDPKDIEDWKHIEPNTLFVIKQPNGETLYFTVVNPNPNPEGATPAENLVRVYPELPAKGSALKKGEHGTPVHENTAPTQIPHVFREPVSFLADVFVGNKLIMGDVKVDDKSVVENGVARIRTKSPYNPETNKIVTEADLNGGGGSSNTPKLIEVDDIQAISPAILDQASVGDVIVYGGESYTIAYNDGAEIDIVKVDSSGVTTVVYMHEEIDADVYQWEYNDTIVKEIPPADEYISWSYTVVGGDDERQIPIPNEFKDIIRKYKLFELSIDDAIEDGLLFSGLVSTFALCPMYYEASLTAGSNIGAIITNSVVINIEGYTFSATDRLNIALIPLM